MLTIYENNALGKLSECNEIKHNALIHMVNPTEEEITMTANRLNLSKDFFRDSLDKNERPRIDREGNGFLIVLNLPVVNDGEKVTKAVPYRTMPIGIIHAPDNLIIVSGEEIPLIEQLMAGEFGDFQCHMKTRITLLLFQAIAQSYDDHLGEISQRVGDLQRQLKVAYRNQELFGLINLNKSLVYFSTSLNAMTILYRRLMAGNDIKLYEEDKRWLQDALIDIEQSAEVTEMRRESLSNLMDAYAAIIHNNLNSVLKLLTSLAIVMVIPTMIGSIFSMNVALPHEEEWISTIIIGIGMVVLSALLALFFYKKNYLRIS